LELPSGKKICIDNLSLPKDYGYTRKNKISDVHADAFSSKPKGRIFTFSVFPRMECVVHEEEKLLEVHRSIYSMVLSGSPFSSSSSVAVGPFSSVDAEVVILSA